MAAFAWTRPGLMRAWLLGTTALLPATGALAQSVAPNALPTGGQVSAGRASIAQSGTAMQVQQGSDRAAINWQSFNIGANASVNFQQPSASSWTLNRVTGPDPSVIAGRMTANGGVAVVNQSGIVFAQGAQVNVGSLIASAANVTNENFMAGRMVFDGAPKPGATVENHGNITVADRGLAALVGPRVANSGTIRARLGRVALQGAETYSLDLAGDGLLSIDVTQAVRATPGGAALVTNSGVIEANGGSILISAHAASGLVEDLVRNTGRISANTAAGRTGQVALRAEGGGVRVDGTVTTTGGATGQGGRIELRGSSATTVGATARVSASGGAGGGTVLVGTSGVGRNQHMSARTTVEAGARIRANARNSGNGGTIAVNSSTETVAKGSFQARGGRQGGNGGLVELSGQGALTIAAQVDVGANAGRRGTILLDPTNIQVVADSDPDVPVADPGAPLSTITATTGGSGVLKIRASDLDNAAATVTLQASQNITISTAVNVGANTLQLYADGAISQDSSATITAGSLVIRAANGLGAAASADLKAANQVGSLDALVSGTLYFNNGSAGLTVTQASGSAITLKTQGSLALAGAVGQAGASVTLNVDGAISQSVGPITAATLTVAGAANAAPSSVALDQANAVGTLEAKSAGNLSFTNGATALTVAQAATTGDSAAVSLTSGKGITLTGTVGGAGSDAVASTGAAVTLNAGGNITQTGSSAIAAVSVDATATGGSITLDRSGNQIAGLTATAIGAGNGIAVTSGTAMSILTGGVTAGSGATIGLKATGITVGHAIGFAMPDSANRINLVADSLTATAAIDAGTSGRVTIAPLSANRGVDIGGATTGALLLDPTALSQVTAERLTISATGSGAVTVSTNLTPTSGTLELTAGGDITQASGKAIAVGTLIVNSSGGDITLDQANAVGTLDAVAKNALRFNNGSANLTVTQALGSSVTLVTTGGLDLHGAVGGSGSSVALNVDGTIAQTASGIITADSLTIRGSAGTAATAGAVLLDTAQNAVKSLDLASTNLTSASFANDATDLTIAGWTASGARLTTGGKLAITGALDVGTTGEVLILAGGDISQSGTGAITAGTLTIKDKSGSGPTSGAVGLGTLVNSVDEIDIQSSAAVSFDNGSSNLLLTRATGSSIAITAGTLTVPAAAVVTAGMGGTISLRIDGLSWGGLINAGIAGTVEIGPRTNATSVSLGAGGLGSLQIDPGSFDSSRLITGTFRVGQTTIGGSTIRANGVTVSGTVTADVASLANGLELIADAGKAISVEAALNLAGRGVSLLTSGTVSQTATGGITASALIVAAPDGGDAGAITLNAAANKVGILSARSSAGIGFLNDTVALTISRATGGGLAPVVSIKSTGDISLTGAVGGTGATVSLTSSAGKIQQSGSLAITAGSLNVDANGLIDLGLDNDVQSAGLTAGAALGFRSTRDLTVTGVSGSIVSLEGASLTLAGAVSGTSSVALLTNGTVSQMAAGKITTPSLTIRSAAGGDAGEIALAAVANAVGSLSAQSNAGIAFLNDATNLTVARATSSGAASQTITLQAAGDLSLTGAVGGTGHTVSLTSTAGQVAQSGSGIITAGSLTVSAKTAINLVLNNLVAKAGLAAGTTLGFVSTSDLTVTGASGTAVALTAASLNLTGAIGGSTNLSLTSTAGGISQTTAGVISTPLLSASATGGAVALAAANDLATGNAIGKVEASSDTGGVALFSRMAMDVHAAGSGISAATGSTIALAGPDITVSKAVGFSGATTGNLITISTDALAATAAINAGTSGRVTITPLSANTGIDIGGATASALRLSAATLGQVTAGRLVIASTGTSSLALNTNLSLSTVGTLELIAAAGISQDSATHIEVGKLTATATGGAITLGGANLIGSIAGSTADSAGGIIAGDAITLTNAQAITLNAAVQAGAGKTIAVTADGMIFNADVATSGGTVQLRPFSADTSVELGGSTLAGALHLTNASLDHVQAATLDIAATGAGNILVSGAADFRAAPVDAGSAVGGVRVSALVLAGTKVSDTPAGALNIGRLTATASDQISLTGGLHAVDALTATAPGAISFAGSRELTVHGAAAAGAARAGNVSLLAPALTLAGPVRGSVVSLVATALGGGITTSGGLVDAGRLVLTTNGGDATLDAAGNTIDWLSAADLRQTSPADTAAGTLTLRNANDLALDRNGGTGIIAGSIDIAVAAGKAIKAGPNGNEVLLRAVGSSGGSGLLVLSADSVALSPTATGDIANTLLQASGAAGRVELRPVTAAHRVQIGGSSPGSALLLASDALGRIDAARLVIGTLSGGAIDIAGAVTINGALTTLDLRSAAGISQRSGATVSVAGLTAVAGSGAGDAISLGEANSIGTIAANLAPGHTSDGLLAGGDIRIATTGTLTVNAPITAGAGRTLTVQANDLALNAALGGTDGNLLALNLLPYSNGRAVGLGTDQGALGAGFYLNSTEVGLLHAGTGTLRIGGDGSAAPSAGSITVYGDVLLTGGSASAAVLDLQGQSVAQNGGKVAVSTLVGTATAGDFVLDRLDGSGLGVNLIDNLGRAGAGNTTAITATDGSVRIASGHALTVRGDVLASAATGSGTARVALRGAGLTIGDDAAPAKSVLVQAGRGDAILNAGSGTFTLAAGSTIRAQDPASLAAEGMGGDFYGNIGINAGSALISGTLDASRASGGRDIGVSAETISLTSTAMLDARRNASLDNTVLGSSATISTLAGSKVTAETTVTLNGSGDVTLRGNITSGYALTIASSFGNVVQSAGSSITASNGSQPGQAMVIAAGDIRVSGSIDGKGGWLSLTSTGGEIRNDGTLKANASIAMTASGGSGTGSTAGSGIITNLGTITGGTVTLDAARAISNVESMAGPPALTGPAVITGTDITLTVGTAGTGTSLTLGAGSSIMAGGVLTLRAKGGDIGATDATLSAGAGLTLRSDLGSITQIRGSTSGTGAVLLDAKQAITVTGNGSITPVLRSTGDTLTLTTMQGAIGIDNATLRAANSASLTAGTAPGSGAGISFSSASLTAGTTLALKADGAVTLTGSALSAGGGLTVTALSGSIGLTGSSLTAVTSLSASAGGSIQATDSSLTAGGMMGLAAGVGSGGDIGLATSTLNAGTVLTLQASDDGSKTLGNITQTAGGRIITPMLTGSAGGSVTFINGVSLPSALVARGSGNAITAIGGFTAGGDFTLASEATPLQVTGLIQVGSNRSLRLFADDLALTAGLRASGGTITLSPYTRDGSIALALGGASGASAANTITLDSAELALLSTDATSALRFGRADNPAGRSDLASIGITGNVYLADFPTGANARVGRLELFSRGGITQQSGSRLVVPVLAATSETGAISLDPGGTAGQSANRIGGLAGIQAPGGFTFRNGSTGAVTVAAGSSTPGDAGYSAAGDAILVGSGQAIILQTNDLAISAPVRAPLGTIAVLPETAGYQITLGGTVAGTLSLNMAELALLGGGASLDPTAAKILRIGSRTDLAAATAGDIVLTTEGTTASVNLQGNTARAEALELVSTGSVQGSNGAVLAGAVRAAAAGDVLLDNAGNSFLVNSVTAGTGRTVAITQAGNLRLANAVATIGGVTAAGGVSAPGGTVRLVAGGTIDQDSGALISTRALRIASGGMVTLTEANDFSFFGTTTGLLSTGIHGGTVRGLAYTVDGTTSITTSATLQADQGLSVTSLILAGDTLTLKASAGNVTLAGATIGAGGALNIRAEAGEIRQGTSSVTGARDVLLSARDGITLSSGGTNLLRSTGGALSLLNAAGPIAIGGSTLSAKTGLTVTAGTDATKGGNLSVAGAILQAGGAMMLTSVRGSGPSASAGTMDITASTATAGTNLALTTGGPLTVTSSSLEATAGSFDATAGQGDIALKTGSRVIAGTSLDVTASTGAILLNASGLQAAGALTLHAATGISVSLAGPSMPSLRSSGGSVSITTDAGDLVFTNSTVNAATDAALKAATGAVSLLSTTLLATGGTATLEAGAAMTLTASGVTAGQALQAKAGTGLDLTGATLQAGTMLGLTATDGAIGIDTSTLTASGRVSLSAGTGIATTSSSIAAGQALAGTTATGGIGFTDSTVTAGADLDLTAATGAIRQTRGTISGAGAVTLRAGNGITVTDASGAAPVLRSTGSSLSLTAMGGDIVLTNAMLSSATSLGATASANIAIDGGSLIAGTTLALTATTGGISQTHGAVSGGAVTLQAVTGITVTSDGGAAATLGSSGGSLSLASTAGDIALTDAFVTAATTLGLTAGTGAIRQIRGLVSGGGAVTLQAQTGISVTDTGGTPAPGATAPALRSTGSSLGLTSATGDIALTNATLSAATGLGLTAVTGAISQTHGAVTGGDAVSLQAGTSITVTDAGGATPSLTSTGKSLSLAAGSGAISLTHATLSAFTSLDAMAGGAITISGSSLGAGSTLSIGAGGAIGLTGTTLTAGTDQTLTAGTGISATGSSLAATSGALAAVTSQGDLALDTATVIAATTLGLTATTGAISQTRGTVSGGAVTVQAGSGITVTSDGGASPVLRSTGSSLGLTAGSGNIVLTSATLSALTSLGISAGGAIGISSGSLGAGSTLALSAGGGIALANTGLTAGTDQTLSAGQGISVAATMLTATNGGISATTGQGALSLTGATLGAGKAIGLTANAGTIGASGSSLTASTTMDLAAASGIALGTSTLASGGAMAASTSSGALALTDSSLTATGMLGLTAGTGAVSQTRGTVSGAAGVTVKAGSGITLTNAGGAAPVLRSTGGAIAATVDTGDIALTNASLAASGALALQATTGGVTIGSSSLASGGSGSIFAGGAVGLTATTITATMDQAVTAGGSLTATGSSLTAGRDLTIGAGTGFGLTSSSVKAGRNLAVTIRFGNAAIADGTLSAGSTLAVAATAGAVTQTRGSIIGAGDTSLRGGTDVTVTDAGSGTQPVLRSTGGGLAVTAGSGAVTLRNARLDSATTLGLTAGNGIGLTDTVLTTTGRLAAAAGNGSLAVLRSTVTSTAGEIDMTAGGTGTITSSTLRAPSAAGTVRVVTTGGLTLTTLTVNADAADFEAGRTAPTDSKSYGATNGSAVLTADGVTASIGTKILFAGPGGVTGIGPTLVTPRGTPLPAVLFDTRIAPTANPLTIVQPDTAGVVAAQQPTQVRSSPGSQSPGAFGLPNQTTAAGTANINVNAGQSAVFLLVDGGSVLGTINAGRLAIHGAGGGMSLFGTLGGSQGAEAARFADITRPIDANSLQRYRINACVVSSINCVVPPSIQLIPPRPSDRAQFSIENNRLNTSDVLIPNVAEEIDQ